MFSSWRLSLALVFAFALVVSAPTAGQVARAELELVRAGSVDNATLALESIRVCLNTAVYVLAFRLDAEGGMAAINREEPDGSVGELQEVVAVLAGDNGGWSWGVFIVDEPGCYLMAAGGGSARLYRLRVGVDW